MKTNVKRMQRVMVWLGVACVGLLPLGSLSAQEPKLRATFDGHTDIVNSVAFSPDGKTLAAGSHYMTIKLWDVATGKEQADLKGSAVRDGAQRAHTEPVQSVAYSPGGKTLASGSQDHTIRLWDVATGKERAVLGHGQTVYSVAYSPDGKTLASGSGGIENGRIKLWDVATGKEKANLKGPVNLVYSVAFSPDGKTLATLEGNQIVLLDVASGKKTATLGTGNWGALAFSPDGKILAAAGEKTILWDVASAKETYAAPDHLSVVSVAYSLDGKILASARVDNTIKLWDVASRKNTATLKPDTYWLGRNRVCRVMSVGFSPDGKTVASVGWIWEDFPKHIAVGGEMKLWDMTTGKNTVTFQSGTILVTCVAFSPDGKTLASGSRDGTIKLWDVAAVQKADDDHAKANKPAAEDDTKAEEAIKTMGGKVGRDVSAEGKPIIKVTFGNGRDPALKELAGLKSLRYLGLNGTKVTDAGLKEIAGLKGLQTLDLFGTKVTDDGLKELAGFNNLQVLALANTQVTDTGLKHLAGLNSLHTLKLGGTKVEGLKHLAGLASLQELLLANTKVADAGLKEFAGLQSLQTLDLWNTQVTDAGLKELAGLKSLRTLHLPNTKVTDVGLKELARHKGLQKLSLAGTQVTDAGVAELRKALPSCKIQR